MQDRHQSAERQRAPRIRFAELVSAAFALYKTRFRAVMMPSLIILLPIYALYFGMYAAMVVIPMTGASSGAIVAAISFLNLGILAFSVAVILLGYPATYAQYVAFLYPQCSGMTALRFAFARYGRSVGVPFMASLPSIGGAYVCYIPLVGSAVAWTVYVLAIESVYLFTYELVLGGTFAFIGIWFLYAIASVLALSSAMSLTIPASAKLDLTVGKAMKYSLRRVGRVLTSHMLASFLYMLCATVAAGIFVVAFYAMRQSAYGDLAALLPLSVLAVLVYLSLTVFGAPLMIALSCAVFNLTKEQTQTPNLPEKTETGDAEA